MSIRSELAKQRFIKYALKGTKAVLMRELDLKELVITMSETHRAEFKRKMHDKVGYPYAYMILSSLAIETDRQNNVAMRKVGVSAQSVGSDAMVKRAFMFPFALELEFHYVDNDQDNILDIAAALGILSTTSGLAFRTCVDSMTVGAYIELPASTAIGISEEENASTPEATDVTGTFIVHGGTGFTRDVAAVNGEGATMTISVVNTLAGTNPENYELTIDKDSL